MRILTMTQEKNLGGRPRKYNSPEEFDAKVDEYFIECDGPVTWTGLALHLGFCSRSAIDEYAEYDGFSYSVKRAKLLVEHNYEKRLGNSELSPSGTIFALKNFNWTDKTQTELSGPNGGPIKGLQVTFIDSASE